MYRVGVARVQLRLSLKKKEQASFVYISSLQQSATYLVNVTAKMSGEQSGKVMALPLEGLNLNQNFEALVVGQFVLAFS